MSEGSKPSLPPGGRWHLRRFPFREAYIANDGRSLRNGKFAIALSYAILPQSRHSRASSLPEGANR